MGPQPGDDAATAIRALALSEPERVVLEIGERHVTASELDLAVERLATRLVRDLVTDDADHPAVGLRTEGAEELMTAILAVQRAGLISVPLDPNAPLNRVELVLADVGAQLLLSDLPGDDVLPVSVAHPLQHTAEPGAAPQPNALPQ